MPSAEFKDCPAVRLEVVAQVWQDRSVGAATIRAAVEGSSGFMASDLRHQAFDVPTADVGRVGDDEVKAAGQGIGPVACDKGGAMAPG